MDCNYLELIQNNDITPRKFCFKNLMDDNNKKKKEGKVKP